MMQSGKLLKNLLKKYFNSDLFIVNNDRNHMCEFVIPCYQVIVSKLILKVVTTE